MKWLLVVLAAAMLCSLSALAATDLTGSWKGTADTPNGTLERTFKFRMEGSKLTGETDSQMLGISTINNGKVEGDSVTFTINAKFQDQEMALTYSGKIISANEVRFKVKGVSGMEIEYIVKRVP